MDQTGEESMDVAGGDGRTEEAGAPESPNPARGVGLRLLGALAFGALTFGSAALGASLSKPDRWYRRLRKAKGNPPSWVFGPVWSVLYTAIAASGYRVWAAPSSPERARALRLWTLQMGLNASWSPLFFGRRQPVASAAVALALVPAIAAYAVAARKVDRKAAALMLPYLGWSTFAAYLNAEIVRKNMRELVRKNARKNLRHAGKLVRKDARMIASI
jgi:tryptophan-rich sensory protein